MAVLLAVLVSNSVAATVAVFEIEVVRLLGTPTTIVTVAVEPLAIVPKLAVTVPEL